MPSDDLVGAAYKTKAKDKIQGSIYLYKSCSKEKWLLKMSLNFRDNQKNKKAPEAKDKVNQVKEGFEAKKCSEKARKEKKKDSH